MISLFPRASHWIDFSGIKSSPNETLRVMSGTLFTPDVSMQFLSYSQFGRTNRQCFNKSIILTNTNLMNFQNSIESGNLDLCYYNFLCAFNILGFNDFNHIFSNVGYIILGVLFLLTNLIRQKTIKQREVRTLMCYDTVKLNWSLLKRGNVKGCTNLDIVKNILTH